MKSKLTRFISMLLTVVVFCGVLPFAVTANAYYHHEGISMVKLYDEIESEYDKFIYLGEEAYEEDYHGNLVLTDYYVQPGDWITYRLYIKSDLYIGNSMPYTAYDNQFFDVRICTDEPILDGNSGYETLNDRAPKNPCHPMVEKQHLYHSLTSKPANGMTAIKIGFCELDVDSATLDLTMNQWTKDTTVYPQMNVFTSDEWLLEWKVQVKEDLADGTRGVSQIYYNMFKYAKRSDTGVADSRRPADISSADCEEDIPLLENAPGYRQSKNMYVNRDIIQHFLVEDTYMEFTVGENPEYGGSYDPDECMHRYSCETIEPDCENKGKEIFTCIRCGDMFTRSIPATEHTAGEMIFELNENSTSDGNWVKKCTKCGSVLESEALSISILAPEPATVNLGDSIWLHAEVKGTLPEDSEIIWTKSNDNFEIVELSEDGKSCKITAAANGETAFNVSVVDSNENVIVTDEQDIATEADLMQKIIALFKDFFNDIITFFKSLGALFSF